MEKICCIISAGDVNTKLLKKMKSKYNFFIAADLGYKKATEAGIIPPLVVGDFDSLGQHFSIPPADVHCPSPVSFSSKPAAALISATTEFIQFPPEKDYSDTHLAIEEGIKLGYTRFEVYGALGGDRFSHSLANLQMLCFMKSKDINVTLVGTKEIVYLLNQETLTLTPPVHSTFSVFAMSDNCTGVTINGAKYPLENATLTNTFPLGVSNLSTNETVNISVKEGFLLVIQEF